MKNGWVDPLDKGSRPLGRGPEGRSPQGMSKTGGGGLAKVPNVCVRKNLPNIEWHTQGGEGAN